MWDILYHFVSWYGCGAGGWDRIWYSFLTICIWYVHWFITQRALFFLALYFSCCQAVLSVALTGCRLCPSDADTTFRLKETLRIPLKFPYLPAPGTYSHPCLRCASLARPCASVAGYCGILSVSNRLHISYPHSGEQSPAYCQTLERQALSAKEKCSARKTALWR